MTTTTPTSNGIAGDRGYAATLAHGSLVDWPAILVGALIATAFAALLTAFGASIGLSMGSPWSSEGFSATPIGIAGAIWFALSHIYAIGMGAYMAGRMRPRVQIIDRDEIEFRDGLNGLGVWALAVVFSILLTAQVISGSARFVANAGSTIGSGIVGGAQMPAVSNAVDNASMEIYRASRRPVGGEGSADEDNTDTGNAAPANNQANRTSAARIDSQDVLRVIAARLGDGEFSEADKNYVVRVLAERSGMSETAIQERISEVAATSAKSVKEAVDAARSTAATTGFWTVFIFLISGLAAWWSGSVGGVHRDTE